MESKHNKGFSTQGIDPPRAPLNERSWNRTAQISEARSASPALPTDFSTNEGADRSPHAGRREEGISVLVPPERFRIPSQGPHCMRHAYAVNLLKNGTALKTIGDILGHRCAESTVTYLRLATDDLRDVALSVPRMPGQREVRP